MEWNSSFTERFNELTEGKTLTQISELLGLSISCVGYYRTGERKPKDSGIAFIAEKFGVNPYWLCGANVPKFREASKIKLEDLTDKQSECLTLIMQMNEKQLDFFMTTAEAILSL